MIAATLAPADTGFSVSDLATAYDDEDLNWYRRTLRAPLGAGLDRLERALGLLESTRNGVPGTAPSPGHLEQELSEALSALTPMWGQRATLCCFLSSRLFNAWDRALDEGQIRAAVQSVRSTIEQHVGRHPADTEAQLLLHQADHDIGRLGLELLVEESVNAGCPAATRRAAEDVLGSLEREAAALAETTFAPFDELIDVYRQRINDDRHYYGAIVKAADGVRAVLAGGEGALADAEVIANQIDADARWIAGTDRTEAPQGKLSWASEIRAHGQALRQLLRCGDKPRLQIDEGSITYLYPFSFWGAKAMKPEDLLDACRDDQGRWNQRALGPVRPEAIEPVLVTDVWSPFHSQSTLFMEDTGRSEPGEQTFVFDGGVIRLPDLRLETADETIEFEASVLVTRAGTHVVRLGAELAEADPHGLYRALRRVTTRLAGDTLRARIDGRWSEPLDVADLRSMARAIATDLAAVVQAVMVDSGLVPPERGVEIVTIPEADHHTILRVGEMSKVDPAGGPTVTIEADELMAGIEDGTEEVFGARLLTTSLTRSAAALEDWVTVPAAMATDLTDDLDLMGERIHRLGMTTVLIMTRSPEWLAWEYAEAAELVAILPPMFNRWRRDLDELVGGTPDELARGTRSRKEDDLPLADRQRDLETIRELQLQLRRLAGRAGGLLARYRSDEICKTAQHRMLLDALMDASPIGRLEGALETRLELSDHLFAGIENDLAKDYQAGMDERSRKFETAVQTVGSILAVFALADLFAFVQSGLELSTGWVIGMIVALVGFALGMYLYVNRKLARLSDVEWRPLPAWLEEYLVRRGIR